MARAAPRRGRHRSALLRSQRASAPARLGRSTGPGGGIGHRAPGRRAALQWLRRGAVKPADIAALARQLATLIRAGVPLVQAFDIVAGGTEKPAVADLIKAIRGDVSAGDSFAAALARHPAHFEALFRNLVAAGEQSGTLPTMLERVATHRENAERLKAKLKRAMTYPVAVLCVALAVSAILLVEVVPQFQQIFAGFGAELPASTLMVIEMSEFLQEWWLTLLAGIGGALFGARLAARRWAAGQRWADQLKLRLPIVGNVAGKSAVARCMRTLATAFGSGVPLVEALRSVAGAAGNVVFERAVLAMREEVAAGREINAAMSDAKVFPSLVVQMVAVGEASGTLEQMLDRAAAWYEAQVDDAVDGLAALAEPAIMAVLGLLIGGLVAAMYLPIFQLGGVVGA